MGLIHVNRVNKGLLNMKPEPNVTGIPYNFDLLAIWIYPNLWDETKRVRLRGLWFVLLYALSYLVFFSLFMFFGAILFSRPIGAMLYFSLIISLPLGGIVGLANWWDFIRRRRKLLAEENKKSKRGSID